MQSGFQSYILRYDGSGKPALSEHTLPLHPAQPSSPDLPEGKTYLISGFSSLTNDSPVPISPTLQLNADLSDFSSGQLASIARAELNRLTRINYRSFIKEMNPRVVVIGKTAAAIDRFTDTYGSVLDIEPLLSTGIDPDICTAEELDIREARNGLRLSFLTRVPIDLNRCTYCGSCGPICPEQCIDEHLFLDLGKCSFCKECIMICPEEVIDLHGVEKRTLHTPALLLLEGVDLENPGTSDTIFTEKNTVFTEKNISRLFAEICACRIDETITCDNTICQYIGRLDQGCEQCLHACSHGALQKDEDGIRVDQERCVECGACVAICPTGAMQSLRFSDARFIEYFSDIHLDSASTVVLGSEHLLHKFWWLNHGHRFAHTFFLEHPSVEALNLMHLLFLLALGANRILILRDKEHDDLSLSRQIGQANAIAGDLCAGHPVVLTTDLQGLRDLLATTPKAPCPADIYSDFSFTGRRQKLASVLAFFTDQKKLTNTCSGELFSEFGAVACDQNRCSSCLACVGECRIESLVADSEQFALLQTPILCTQCTVCISLCPENALTLVPGLTLSKDFFNPKLLAQAEPMRCRHCGKIFGTRQSFERVMHVLQNKQPELDLDLFSYCEDCRVLQMIAGTNA